MRIKKALRLFLALGICALTASCYKEMDPFTGSIGVRANINGEKFICITGEDRTPYAIMEGDTFSMEEKLAGTETWERIMNKQDRKSLILSINLQGETMLGTNTDYTIGTGNNTASLRQYSGDQDIIPLKGWIRFLTIDSKVEARFELESVTGDYEIRHGFCRLQRR